MRFSRANSQSKETSGRDIRRSYFSDPDAEISAKKMDKNDSTKF